MEEDKIRQFIDEIDPDGKLPRDNVENFIQGVLDIQKNPPKDGDKIGDLTVSIGGLRAQMEFETDWRKKASLAAKIISLGLD